MNILTAYYHISYDILKEHLPFKPELKLTNAKGYYGKIIMENGNAEIILSKWNLEVSEYLIEEEDIDEIIETICHEFAHMFFICHDEDHAELTNAFKTVVSSQLKIRRLEYTLSK
jgi:predicted SprT family Zn-dependent metalloprotease